MPLPRPLKALAALFAILLLLAVAAVLRVARAPRRQSRDAGDSATLGRLGALRSRVAVYLADNPGQTPHDPSALASQPAQTGAHPDSETLTVYGAEACAPGGGPPAIAAGKIRDTGGWGLVRASKSRCDGMVFVDCAHADRSGAPWTSY